MQQHRGITGSGRRAFGWGARTLAVLALVGASLAVGPSAAGAAGVLTVTPSTGLADGQTVTLHGSGWEPGHNIAFCQGIRLDPPSPSDCADGRYTVVVVDGAGAFEQTLAVYRSILVPSLGHRVDCADPAQQCVIGVADVSDYLRTTVRVDIEMVPGPPLVMPGVGDVFEGDEGPGPLTVPVILSGPSDVPITAQWTTQYDPDGAPTPADPATDYTAASGTLTFPPGATASAVELTVTGDNLVEHDEYVTIVFSGLTNAQLGGPSPVGVGSIRNDDHTTVLPGGLPVVEGDTGVRDHQWRVRLTNPSVLPVTVDWVTMSVPEAPPSPASPTTDYTPASGTVTFAPGQTVQMVHLDVLGDTLVEPNEYIIVSFRNPTNASVGGFWGLAFPHIINDD